MTAVGWEYGRVGRKLTRNPLVGTSGQATTELVGMLPILVAIVLGVAQLLAAGLAHELADHAAEAGAVAILEGTDPERAARDALPGWAAGRMAVTVRDSRVEVTIDPPGPARATARATASAPAAPTAVAAPHQVTSVATRTTSAVPHWAPTPATPAALGQPRASFTGASA